MSPFDQHNAALVRALLLSNTIMKILYPANSELVDIESIITEDRGREDYGDLQELADSISELGIIHPPTIAGEGELIAGGRRLAAMKLLGVNPVPVNRRENMPKHLIVELELEENIKRLDMKWQEKVLLIYKTHELKNVESIKRGKSWKQSETGKLLGVSNGHVSHALHIAKLMMEGDEEVTASKNLIEAWNIVMARREREAMAQIAERSGAVVRTPKASDAVVVDFDGGGAGVANTDMHTPSTEELGLTSFRESELQTVSPEASVSHDIDLGTIFSHGDCIEVMASMPEKSVDHVVTDIPYGIDMGNLDTMKNIESVASTHDVAQNVEMMPKFLKAAYRLIRDGGFCVFWYDLDHHEKLHVWAKEAGFTSQSWPLVWCKTHTCLNQSATKNYTKSTEVAMVLRKDSDSNLKKTANKNYLIADGLAEKKLYDNPFAKPFEAWKFILEHVGFKGQIVLDPFGGQMSSVRAMINLGFVPRAIEIDPYHFVQGIKGVTELYSEMLQDKVSFSNNPADNIDPESILKPATNE